MFNRRFSGISEEEREALRALWQLEAQAEAELHRLEHMGEDVSHRHAEVRRRLYRG